MPAQRRTASPKDTGRQKVYDAEWSNTWTDKAAARLDGSQAQAEADKMHRWLVDQGFSVPLRATVEMKVGGWSSARRGDGLIRLSSTNNYRWVLCHEMAHLVELNFGKFTGDAADRRPHGRAFCHVYLRLVRKFCGVADHDTLRDSFRRHGVKYTAKRTMTAEQKAAAAERLAAHRPVKSPHRWAMQATFPNGTVGYLTASPRSYITIPRPDGKGFAIAYYLTTRPDKAVTRATSDSLSKYAADVEWRLATDATWTVVDLNALELTR